MISGHPGHEPLRTFTISDVIYNIQRDLLHVSHKLHFATGSVTWCHGEGSSLTIQNEMEHMTLVVAPQSIST